MSVHPHQQTEMEGLDALSVLAPLNKMLVKQQVELLEVMTGFEGANKYKVLDGEGNKIFYALEQTDFCTRNCLGSSRPFSIGLLDAQNQEAIRVVRKYRCHLMCMNCCKCCQDEVKVQCPPGNTIGRVRQRFNCCRPIYEVMDKDKNVVLKIEGPHFCNCKCFTFEFRVLSADGDKEVGMIAKKWSGLAKEIFTDADNFGISFPEDLDVRAKASVLGAVFLIDFMFFEDDGNNDSFK